MANPAVAETIWQPDKKLIVTRLSGGAEKSDVEEWASSLRKVLSRLPDNETFKILVDTYGFRAASIEAHKQFRNCVPLILSDYGWRVGYLALFEESDSVTVKNIRGIRCVAAAHVHRDKAKMQYFDACFGDDQERFFADPEQAIRWIEELAATA